MVRFNLRPPPSRHPPDKIFKNTIEEVLLYYYFVTGLCSRHYEKTVWNILARTKCTARTTAFKDLFR